MQRLYIAALLLMVLGSIVWILGLGVRQAAREGRLTPARTEGNSVQKLAYIALILLIAGVSTGYLGGL
jgi:hypothetical protein